MADVFDNITPEQQANISELHFFSAADGVAFANGASPPAPRLVPPPGTVDDEPPPAPSPFHIDSLPRVTIAVVVLRDGAVRVGASMADPDVEPDPDEQRNAALMAALVRF